MIEQSSSGKKDRATPHRRWSRKPASAAVAMLLLGMVALMAAGVELPSVHLGWYRLVLAVVGFALLFAFALTWAASDHEMTEMEGTAAEDLLIPFELDNWSGLLNRAARIIEHYAVSDDDLDQLAFDLAAPTGYRDIREFVTLETNGLKRRVELTLEHPAGPPPKFILLARPLKGERFDAFKLEDPGFRLLSVIETDAIVLAVILACTQGSSNDAKQARELAGQLAATLLGGTTSVDRSLLPTTDDAYRHSVCRALLALAEKRRPIIAMRVGHAPARPHAPEGAAVTGSVADPTPETHRAMPEASSIAWSYIEPIEITHVKRGWLTEITSHVRGMLHGKILRIPLDRALWARRYQLTLLVPSYAYVRTSFVTTGREAPPYLMPSHEPGRVYQNFFIQYAWPGRSAVRVSLNGWRRSKTPQPVLYARIRERPPGRRAVAALVAAATVLTVLAAASLFPDGGSKTVDLAALGVALPAAIVSVYNLREAQADVTRSWSARISLSISLMSSVAGSFLYLTFDSGRLSNGESTYVGDQHVVSLLGIHNVFWLVLTAIVLANALFIALRLVIEVRRYRDALAEA